MKISKSQDGFSLIELMVVSTIIGILSVTVIFNFRGSGNRTALIQARQQFMSDLRRAQSMATSSTRVGGQVRCGFGVYYVDSSLYGIYTGPESQTTDCSAENKNYEVGRDSVYQGISLVSGNIEFLSSFPDIFFEPPDPKTYIDNMTGPSVDPIVIVLRIIGGRCPDDCSSVVVSPVGLIRDQ